MCKIYVGLQVAPMTYTLQVRSSEKFKDQNKQSAKYKQKHTTLQAHTHIYHKMQSHNLKSQTESKSCSRWTKRHIKWQDVQHTKHPWSTTSRAPIYPNTRKTQNSITDQQHLEHQSIQTQEKHRTASLINNILNTSLSKHKKNTEQHHWSTTSWTPVYPNTRKTQNSITDQQHLEHQSIQTQQKHRTASLINHIMNANLSKHSKNTEQHHWSTTSWTPIYPNTAKTQNNITDQKQCKHQSTNRQEKTQNNITDQKQCKHQSTNRQEKTQNNITDQLHHEHQSIQMQKKEKKE